MTTPTATAAPSRRLWIETVGCQMNVLDSELVVAALRRQGWSLAEAPAEADIAERRHRHIDHRLRIALMRPQSARGEKARDDAVKHLQRRLGARRSWLPWPSRWRG